jgi:hypothetical protein
LVVSTELVAVVVESKWSKKCLTMKVDITILEPPITTH